MVGNGSPAAISVYVNACNAGNGAAVVVDWPVVLWPDVAVVTAEGVDVTEGSVVAVDVVAIGSPLLPQETTKNTIPNK